MNLYTFLILKCKGIIGPKASRMQGKGFFSRNWAIFQRYGFEKRNLKWIQMKSDNGTGRASPGRVEKDSNNGKGPWKTGVFYERFKSGCTRGFALVRAKRGWMSIPGSKRIFK
jgi:hypothetical protein